MRPTGRITTALAGIAAAVVIVLLATGTQSRSVRTYAMDVPNLTAITPLGPPRSACEGPIISPFAFQQVSVWSQATTHYAVDVVTVDSTRTHRVLATSGLQAVGPAQFQQDQLMSASVAAGQPVTVCVTTVRGRLILWGSQVGQPTVTATGIPTGEQFSLVLSTRPRDGSLLHWLPTAFARAALWRPSWVGVWTYWLLAALLLAVFAGGVLAVISAAADGDQGEAIDRSKPGQNRP